MPLSEFKNLLDILQVQYSHIIGEQDTKEFSSEKIVAAIVNYYEDIISCMPGNVYWLDKNCVGVGCNKNVLDMFGFKALSQYKGLSFEDMARIGKWSPEAMLAFKNDTLEVLQTGKPRLNVEEPPIPHVNGKTIYFLTSRVPLFDQSNNLIGVVGISIDISEQKQIQLELKQAKELAEAASLSKSEFVANMSHDIKTPLSGIIGLSELLTYRLRGQENLEFAQTILMSGRRLLSFFDNCLEVFKLEAGDVALITERFNIKSVVDEIYELYQPTVKTKEITFSIDCDEQIPEFVIGSCAGFYRVLLNLVGNAVKFTNKGSISVSIMLDAKISPEHKAMIKIIIADTGIGIPADKQHVIFDRFTRLIPSYKGTFEGSGIGLFVVQRYVKSMHGEIHVKSEEGKGSQFIVDIPFDVSLTDAEETKHIPLAKISSHTENDTPPLNLQNIHIENSRRDNQVTILLVEDNLTAQLMGSSLLSSMNFKVDVADSGEKALQMFHPGKYDLIFMDIGLPGIQGDAVTKLIRKMELGTSFHTPIIALTAHTTEDININYLSAGIDSVLSKPLSREQAKRIIEYCFV